MIRQACASVDLFMAQEIGAEDHDGEIGVEGLEIFDELHRGSWGQIWSQDKEVVPAAVKEVLAGAFHVLREVHADAFFRQGML